MTMVEPEVCPWCGRTIQPDEELSAQPDDLPICDWCGRPISQKEETR